ncbi:MAG TPA: PAS domain-containing protein [Terriglobia bacterium]|nr:PAS domain-containing protein [Terriglobia bacterium]
MLQHGRHKATPHLVLAISLLFTVIAAAYASRYRSEQDRLNFNQVVDAQQVKISEALGDRIALLRGIAGLFAARSGVTDEEFQMYAADVGVRDYADIRAIGYSARVKDGDTEHYPITRLESSDNQNDRDLGFDLLTDPVMRPALEQARDSTLPAISNRWTRAADEPIFLICLPRYSLTASLETVEARRETLEGFVFAFIRPDTFTQGTLGARTTPAISLSIFNGNEVGQDRLLYATSLMPVTETPLAAERAVSLSGATWTLKFNQQSFFPNAAQLWFVFLASIGGLVSFVLFFVTRSEAVAHVEADERAEQLEQHRTKLKELISHRNRAEETLRDKEARLQIALSAARMASWHWDLVTGNLMWDDAPYTWTDFVKRVHLDDQPVVRNAVDQALQERQGLDLEFRVVQPDATIRWLTLKAKVFQGEDGRPAYITGVSIDITDRRKAAEALRASEERYRLAARATNDAIWDWDLATGLVQWNEGIRTLFGYTAEQVGTDVRWRFDQIHPDDRERVVSGINAVVEGGGRFWSDEYQFRCANGSYATVTDRAYIEHNESGRAVRLIAAMTDVTRLKQAEREREQLLRLEQTARKQAESANRVKDEFIATLSHELRTPITPILGWTQLLRNRGSDPATLQRGIDVIDRSARSQAKLIEDLLDVSRIVTGKMQLKIQPVEVPRIIQAAIEAVQPAADARGVRIETTTNRSMAQIAADPDRLQQIVWNLVSNAIKFTPKGGLISISAEQAASEMRIVVRDNGEGIDPEFLPHVFDRFSQADSTNVRTHGGLGVGLSIVRYIVELHGGNVMAESLGKGHGATFTVLLPVKTEAKSQTRRSKRIAKAVSSLKGMRLLIVEDEPDARELLALVLEHEGAIVTKAGSVQEALAALQTNAPDILISDIAMPGENGYVLLEKLRRIEKEQERHRVPAIALTAYAREEDRKQAMEAGFKMHLSKPVDPEKLIAAILAVATKHLGKAV